MSGKFLARVALSLVVTVLLLAAAAHVQSDTEAAPAANDLVERGRYLVLVGGCNDCHTPKVMTEQGPQEDHSRLLSGHPAEEKLPPIPSDVIGPGKWGAVCSGGLTAWYGPWGVTYASNLTSDKTAGVGNWTDDQFIGAMRTGKHRGFGRPILPPMPWFNLAKMPDEDLKAILAYLKTVPANSNKVPDAVINKM